MKILSVVVPCYNSADYMKNCIESLIVGGDKIEIIIVDDGSTDKTAFIADGYAEKYPDIVKVIHQENGGHGEGINAGLKIATGKFFKVVDSDDKLSEEFPLFLEKLEGGAKDAELVVTNYVYAYQSGKKDNPVRYANAFKRDKPFCWNDMRKFRLKQFLMVHACTFRTELAKKYGGELPKHVFYEDNLFVGKILPHVTTLYYCDLNLYRYTIGREGQSVSEAVFVNKYKYQILVNELWFDAIDLNAVREKSERLYGLIMQEMLILFGGACVYALKSDDEKARENIENMWEKAFLHDEKNAKKLRYAFIMRFLNVKGNAGRKLAVAIYDLARKIVQFN